MAVSQQGERMPVLQYGDTLYRAVDVLPPDDVGSGWEAERPNWNYSKLLAPFVYKVSVDVPGRIAEHLHHSAEYSLKWVDDVTYMLHRKPSGFWVSGVLFKVGETQWLARTDDDFPWRVQPELEQGTVAYTGHWEIYPLSANYGSNGETSDVISFDRMIRLGFQVTVSALSPGAQMFLPRGQYGVRDYVMAYSYFDAHERTVDASGSWNRADTITMDFPRFLSPHSDFVYWSENHPAPIVVDQRDRQLNTTAIEFKILPLGIPSYPGSSGREDVFVYPNPSYGQVRFDFVNLPTDTYSLEIYNILGLKLRSEEVEISGSRTVQFDFSDLDKGTYIYRLVSSSFRTIRTKRLVIVEP